MELALVHLELPGLGGQATLALLGRGHPAVRVVALCDRVDDLATLRAYDAGVRGVMCSDAGAEDWTAVLADVGAGRVHLNHVLDRLIRGAHRPQRAPRPCTELTDRELETIQWYLREPGATQRQVGEHMGVDACTVHEHLQNIYAKWGVHCVPEALFRALREGLYPG